MDTSMDTGHLKLGKTLPSLILFFLSYDFKNKTNLCVVSLVIGGLIDFAAKQSFWTISDQNAHKIKWVLGIFKQYEKNSKT